MKWRYVIMITAIALLFAVTACTKNNTTGQAGGTTGGTTGGATTGGGTTTGGGAASGGTTTAASAETIAKQNCIACHGDTFDGKGDSKKNLQKVGSKLSKDQISTTIANGRNAMPAFKGRLKDDEIAALADWLAAKK
ncbi:cytochrome c [Paenibacillus piri]|uniref:Cytochrome c n=2 Tax=Paenibacillus piri TaxID=2547395 RepID=A0A4V6PIJ1_9BACL|nr:cytochrome c [Paenibacillus piri]